MTALDVDAHTFNVPSADNLDNRAVQSIAFTIIVTAESIFGTWR